MTLGVGQRLNGGSNLDFGYGTIFGGATIIVRIIVLRTGGDIHLRWRAGVLVRQRYKNVAGFGLDGVDARIGQAVGRRSIGHGW